jgi:hypothetical protein
MPQAVITSGAATQLHRELVTHFGRAEPRAVGVASAFLSEHGIAAMTSLIRASGTRQRRLIAGTAYYVTHPTALFTAADDGWNVRLGSRPRGGGIFHPKLIVAGRAFDAGGLLHGLSLSYLGSGNITRGGLERNVEGAFIATGSDCVAGTAEAFSEYWAAAVPATPAILTRYAAAFAERNRRRAPEEIEALGVSDGRPSTPPPIEQLLQSPAPLRSAVGPSFARAAWAGLQSFTGEWRFQIEFPRAAGLVVRRLVGRQATAGRIPVLCTNDGVTRPMLYDFYQQNSMFRLNVPNEVPGVAWARQHRSGLALVEAGAEAVLNLTLLRPGAHADEVIARSYALGTWSRTTTRLYGWF